MGTHISNFLSSKSEMKIAYINCSFLDLSSGSQFVRALRQPAQLGRHFRVSQQFAFARKCSY